MEVQQAITVKATVWTLLMALPIWFQIVLILSIILLIVLIIKQGFTIARGRFNFKIGNGKKEKISPHKNCSHNKDVIILLHKTDELLYQKWFTQQVDQIREQMNYAEQIFDQVRILLQKKYLSELESRKVSNFIESISFQTYCSILKEVQKLTLLIVRNSLKENHFDLKDEHEFNEYKSEKAIFLISKGTEFLNALYFYSADITRNELYEANQSLVSEFKELIMNCFEQAREISINNKLKVLKIEEQLQALMEDYL